MLGLRDAVSDSSHKNHSSVEKQKVPFGWAAPPFFYLWFKLRKTNAQKEKRKGVEIILQACISC